MFTNLFGRLLPAPLSIILTVVGLIGPLHSYAQYGKVCADLFSDLKINNSATPLVESSKIKNDLYENAKMYRPISYLAQKMGLKYSRVEENVIPLWTDTYSDSGYSVAVVRRFFSDKFVVDITGIEWRAGVSQQLLDRINQSPILPKMKDENGHTITRAEDIKVDFELPPEKRINSVYNSFLFSLKRGVDFTLRKELDAINDEISSRGHAILNELIISYVKFAHLHYQRRGWGPEMLAQLEKKALEYIPKSTYITVREIDSDTGEPGAIVGNLRLISDTYNKTRMKFGNHEWIEINSDSSMGKSRSSPKISRQAYEWKNWVNNQRKDLQEPEVLDHDWLQEKANHYLWWNNKSYKGSNPLMMEDIFRIQLPRPAVLRESYSGFSGEGEIIEPGVFAIDKKFNAQVFTEILSHLMIFVVDPNYSNEFNLNSKAFYTYNDYPQLYSSLGFQKVGEPFKTEYNQKTKKTHLWWILRALPRDILAALERIAFLRKHADLENLQKIKNQLIE